MRAMTIPLWFVTLLAGGCPSNEAPAPKPAVTKPIPEQLRDRRPVPQCSDAELEARAAEDRAVGAVANDDAEDVEREQQRRWVEGWKKWSWICGFIGWGGGLAAGFLVWWFWKTKVGLAFTVGGALAGLGTLAFTFAQIMAHWRLLALVGSILLGVGVIVTALLAVLNKNALKKVASGLSAALDAAKKKYVPGSTKAALKCAGADLKLAESIRQSAKG